MRVLTDARVVYGDRVTPGWIAIDGDVIAAVGAGRPPAGTEVSVAGSYLAPGFVDIHCHGGGGGSYTSADAEQIERARTFHLSHGTTTCVASLVSDTTEALIEQMAALAPFIDDGRLQGIHLEGPWICERYCGAHDRAVLRAPDPREVQVLLEAAGNRICMVTLAPELDGAVPTIEHLVDAGVVVAVGHTDAGGHDVRAALEAGATVATHLFNAMPPLRHRHPGPVGALLSDPRVTVELICDGVHLHRDVVALAVAAASGRAVLVTDAMCAAGVGDGEYRLGPLHVRVADGQARIAATGALAGSTLTMDAALRFLVQQVGVDLPTASAAASGVGAQVLGLGDRGVIAAGARADLVVLSPHLQVEAVMRAGAWAVPLA